MKIYGIKNCNTMQNAMKWLDAHDVKYSFHDYKKEGVTKQKIEDWLNYFPLTELINTKGITYKKLTDLEKQIINNKNSAIELMIQKTSMIKRPILEMKDGFIIVGFKEEIWQKYLLQ